MFQALNHSLGEIVTIACTGTIIRCLLQGFCCIFFSCFPGRHDQPEFRPLKNTTLRQRFSCRYYLRPDSKTLMKHCCWLYPGDSSIFCGRFLQVTVCSDGLHKCKKLFLLRCCHDRRHAEHRRNIIHLCPLTEPASLLPCPVSQICSDINPAFSQFFQQGQRRG